MGCLVPGINYILAPLSFFLVVCSEVWMAGVSSPHKSLPQGANVIISLCIQAVCALFVGSRYSQPMLTEDDQPA